VWWVAVVGLGACTSPNPRSCLDGTCSDPAIPFCDSTGELSGTAGICIAVSCSAGAVEACRVDSALVCSASGANYDVVRCPHGCSLEAPGGCRECASDSAACPADRPVCTSAGSCVRCQNDAECESSVCNLESGSCEPKSSVLYSSPIASATGSCTFDDPCPIMRAIQTAGAALSPPTIRLLPGAYGDELIFTVAKDFTIVATGATLADTAKIAVNGSRVSIRDARFISSLPMSTNIDCRDNSGATPAALTIARSYLKLTGGNGVRVSSCNLVLDQVHFEVDSMSVQILAGGALRMDRSTLRRIAPGDPQVFVSSTATVRLVNTLVENVPVYLETPSPVPTTIPNVIAYSTLVGDGIAQVSFSPSGLPGALVRVENSVFFSTGSDSFSCSRCGFVNCLAHPLGVVTPGVTGADPLFSSATDFTLMATSPALDRGVVASQPLDVVEDLEGRARPQGPAKDLGALERPVP